MTILFRFDSVKTCFKCGLEKEDSEFYTHPRMGDGYLGKCIECTKKDSRKRYILVMSNPELAKKERERNRKRAEVRRANGTAIQPSHEVKRRWIESNQEKRRAQMKAANAQRAVKLKPPQACQACGKTGLKLEKHHPDYLQPLAVKWLCSTCHGITRRKDDPDLTYLA